MHCDDPIYNLPILNEPIFLNKNKIKEEALEYICKKLRDDIVRSVVNTYWVNAFKFFGILGF